MRNTLGTLGTAVLQRDRGTLLFIVYTACAAAATATAGFKEVQQQRLWCSIRSSKAIATHPLDRPTDQHMAFEPLNQRIIRRRATPNIDKL